MGNAPQTLTEALDRLIAVANDPSSGRADISKAADALRNTNAYKRHAADDPLVAAVWTVLSNCTVDDEGCALYDGKHLSVQGLCKLIERPQTPSWYAKVGKICANHGYKRLQATALAPTRLLAPSHLW